MRCGVRRRVEDRFIGKRRCIVNLRLDPTRCQMRLKRIARVCCDHELMPIVPCPFTLRRNTDVSYVDEALQVAASDYISSSTARLVVIQTHIQLRCMS